MTVGEQPLSSDVAGTFEQIGKGVISAYVSALAVWEEQQGAPANAEQSLALLMGIVCDVAEKVYEHGLRLGLETGAAMATVPGAMEAVGKEPAV